MIALKQVNEYLASMPHDVMNDYAPPAIWLDTDSGTYGDAKRLVVIDVSQWSDDDEQVLLFLPAAAAVEPWKRTFVAAGAIGARRGFLLFSDAPPPLPARIMSSVLRTRTRANDEVKEVAFLADDDASGGLGGRPLLSGAEAGCALGMGARPAPKEE